jgi:cytokinin dehydrogenase
MSKNIEALQRSDVFYSDEVSCEATAKDFGGIVRHLPSVVVRPGSKQDIVAAVRFAREQHLSVAARGRGHSTYGQAQCTGLVIDMSLLSQVREIHDDYALVDGGCSWATLVEQSSARGLTPPTLTDYLHLSVGGTLSVGGIGGASFRHGAQTDHVLELEVVTGSGELLSCSPLHCPELFDAVRAGMGQCGVIVGAKIRLIKTPPLVRIYELRYSSLDPFLRDQVRLATEGRFDYLDGTIIAEAPKDLVYVLTVAKQHELNDEPNEKDLLEGLGFTPGAVSVRSCSYLEFTRRVEAYVARLKQLGLWDSPHPWIDLFIPASQAERFIAGATNELTSIRDGMILTYVLHRSRCCTPLLALPNEEHIFLFDFLRNASAEPETIEALLAANVRLARDAVGIGGVIYPIGAVPVSSEEWRHLYPSWAELAAAKRQFDPDNMMTPGQGSPLA